MSMLNQFSNLYPVTKSLSFGLLPVNETAKFIDDYGSEKLKNSIRADVQVQKDAKVIQGFLDARLRCAVTDALNSLANNPECVGFGKLHEHFDKMLVCRMDMMDIDKSSDERMAASDEYVLLQQSARDVISAALKPLDQLLSPSAALKSLTGWMGETGYSDDDISLAEQFKSGAAGYFTKYFNVRAALVTSEDKHNALAHRIININLHNFISNCLTYKGFYKSGASASESKAVITKLNALLSTSFTDVLTQDGIDRYNQMLLGTLNDKRVADKGLNVLIREYRAQTKTHAKHSPLFATLEALLLFGDKKVFVDASDMTDKEVLDTLSGVCADLLGIQVPNLERSVKSLIKSDLSGVYVMPQYLKKISNSVFGVYDLIHAAMKFAGLNSKMPVSLTKLDDVIIDYHVSLDESDEHSSVLGERLLNNRPVLTYFSTPIMKLSDDFAGAVDKASEVLAQDAIDGSRRPPKTLNDGDKGGKGFFQLQKIQGVLAALQALIAHYRPLIPSKGRRPVELLAPDVGFYETFVPVMDEVDQIYFETERMARTHFSKKINKGKKVRLSFDNGYFMSGWSLSNVATSGAVILERDGDYYLAISTAGNRGAFDVSISFDDHLNPKKRAKKLTKLDAIRGDGAGDYKLLVYNQITNFSMTAPRVFLWAENRREFFKPSNEILQIASTSSFTKNGKAKAGYEKVDFNIDDCHKIIDYFKACIDKHPVWNQFDFKFSDTGTYESIDQFYKEVGAQSYKLSKMGISADYVDGLLKDESVFMFKIHRQDFLKAAKGTPDLFTMYFYALFDTESPDNCYKLNGGAEMYFKQHAIKPGAEVIHPKGVPINAKSSGAQSPTRTFDYDIVKNRIATRDSFSLSFSFTANYQKQALTAKQHNEIIDTVMLGDANEVNVLSIHRGERNLLSYVVVNRNGAVVEQGNLNTICNPGTGVGTNYRNLLSNKLKQYKLAQRNWGTTNELKGFKSGYLSHAIPLIIDIAIKYNAYICIENLDGGFVDKHKALDANVYQTFDTKLASKLNYLVIKSKEDGEPAGVNKALQLAQQTGVDGYFKSGIVMKIPAAYTAKTCPRTGFVNLMDLRYKNMRQAKLLLERFSGICYDNEFDMFRFDFDYNDFDLNASFDLGEYRRTWCVSTHGRTRFYYDRINKESVEFDATQSLKDLFDEYGINWHGGSDLVSDITEISSAVFFRTMLTYMSSVFSIKQYQSGTEFSFALSPVMDGKEYYCSMDVLKHEPNGIDELSAYILAKKAWWSLEAVLDGADKVPYVGNEKYFGSVLASG